MPSITLGAHHTGEAGTLHDVDHEPQAVLEATGHETLRRELQCAVRRVCPRSLAEHAEDLVQDAFIRLLRARKLDGQDVSSAYLKKVAYSAVIDEIRRRRRQPAEQAYARVDVESAADELSASPDAALGHALEVGLQTLAPDRRRALTLHLLGYSGSEVADMLGCNAKRADNLTHRGLAQMREYLLKLGLNP